MASPARILIVDDNPEICKLLSMSLAPLGYEVTSANDGFQALEQIETEQFNVAILDLMLPGPNGIEILRHIREQQVETAVIVLTAYASLETAIKALQMGAYDYITKPFHTDAFRATVRRAIEKQLLTTRLTAIHDLSRDMALSLDVNQVANAVLDIVERVLQFEIGGLWLVDEERDELYQLAMRGTEGEGRRQEAGDRKQDKPYRLSLSDEKGITVTVARSEEPLHVPNVQEDPRYVAVGPANRSELAVPLKLRNRVIGVLNVESAKADAFDPDDMKLLSTLAAQAAVAIEHARLHEEQQRRARELAALNTACRAMASTLDIDKVLASAITEARAMLGAEAASVLLHDGAGDALVFSAAAGPGLEELVGTRMPVTAGIAGWIMQEAQPVLIRDAQSDPRFYDRIDTITGLTTRSLLAVPLKYKEQVIGVLEAINKQVGPESPSFTPGDLELLTTLAHHINNRLMTFSLEVDKLERQDLVDQEAVSTVITSARRCIQEVSAVVKALDRLKEIHTVSYVGTAQMIDIEEALQEQLRSIETQRA